MNDPKRGDVVKHWKHLRPEHGSKPHVYEIRDLVLAEWKPATENVDSERTLVTYRGMDGVVWARWLGNFIDDVAEDDYKGERFTRVGCPSCGVRPDSGAGTLLLESTMVACLECDCYWKPEEL